MAQLTSDTGEPAAGQSRLPPAGSYVPYYGGRYGRRGKLGKLFRTAMSVPVIRYQENDQQVSHQEYVNPAYEVGPEGVQGDSRSANRLHSHQSSPAILQKSFLTVPDPESMYGGGEAEQKPPVSVSFSLPTTTSNEGQNGRASGHDSNVPQNSLSVAANTGRRKSSVADIAFNFAKTKTEPTLLDDLRAANIIGSGSTTIDMDVAMGLGHFSRKGHKWFLHPFGNNEQDALESTLFGDIVKHSPGLNPEKLMVWVVFCGFLLGMAALIILGAETAGSPLQPYPFNTTVSPPSDTTAKYM